MDIGQICIGIPVSYNNVLLTPSVTVYGTVVGFDEKQDKVFVRTDLNKNGLPEQGRYETYAVSCARLQPSDHKQRFVKYDADIVNEAMYLARDTFHAKYDYEQIQGMALQYLMMIESDSAGGLPESKRADWIDES